MRRKKVIVKSLIVSVLVLFVAFVSGAVSIPLRVFLFESDATYGTIFWSVRFPRVVLAGLVGAALSVSGVLFQTLLQNPLADPYTLGVSSGASVGAVGAMFFSSFFVWKALTIPFWSMLGAISATILLFGIVSLLDRQFQLMTVLLIGILLASFLSATTSLLLISSGEEMRSMMHWLFGSVSMRGYEHIYFLLPWLFIGIVVAYYDHAALDALRHGEKKAYHLGVNVSRVKKRQYVVAALLAGAAVSVSGMIGFVGLIIPHVTRALVGSQHRRVIPFAALYGATFLIAVDTFGRTIIAPRELPLGIMTAFIGAPIAVFILYKMKRGS